MLISTFELLVKPQLPPGLPAPISNLGRNVIQGYFLTIANLNLVDLALSVVFTIRGDVSGIITFLDTSGVNITGNLTPDIGPNKFRFSPLFLAAQATGLLIIQPNPSLISTLDFEVRGYAEIFLSSLSGTLTNIQLQVTPEQRGTFFGDPTQANIADRGLDQIAYSLPVQNGGFFTLSS